MERNGMQAPWHLLVVAILTLLWNAAGVYTIMMAQAGRLADLKPEEAVYYAAQPLWFVIATDISLLAAIAGAVALLVRSRTAVWLFALSLVSIVVTNAYDLAAGTSRTLANRTAAVVTVGIVVIAILEFAYARAMRTRAVLK
jgi:hypothetical protein